MNLEKENDYTTYLFTLSSLGLILSRVFFKDQYDNISYLSYALIACGFFFIYQFFKLSSLKKELIKSDKKILNKLEKGIRNWAYRSVISNQDIERGQVITEKMICSKRPSGGIPSKDYKKVIGLKAKKSINKNNFIKWDDIE